MGLLGSDEIFGKQSPGEDHRSPGHVLQVYYGTAVFSTQFNCSGSGEYLNFCFQISFNLPPPPQKSLILQFICPGTCYITHDASNFWKSSYPSLPNPGIANMCHNYQHKNRLFEQQTSGYPRLSQKQKVTHHENSPIKFGDKNQRMCQSQLRNTKGPGKWFKG